MSRFIDADVLCEAFTRFVRKANNHDYEPTPNWNDAIAIFHSMPTVDAVDVVHGYWKGKPIAGYCTVRCSVCGSAFLDNDGRWKYCPNCGTKMDGEI